VAWAEASYGAHGFWTTGPGALHGPDAHFRTSTRAGDVLARALAWLVEEIDARLGHPPVLDVVDVGAGDGALLTAILDAVDDASRIRAVAVDVRPAPPGLDPRVTWRQGAAASAAPEGIRGLLLAHELLDEVPLDVVEVDADGSVRLVLVGDDGTETLGPPIDSVHECAELGVDARAARDWLRRWWWPRGVGERAEVGLPRDELWRALASRVRAGTVLAVDYGHDGATRGRHPTGTLAAYADGRRVRAVPDGSVGITAHLAVDPLAAQGATVLDQRTALRSLGVTAALPDPGEPDHLARLVEASHAAELLDPAGLGGWLWVRRDV
jgi:SAM-dependent MidA family methyltransferase